MPLPLPAGLLAELGVHALDIDLQSAGLELMSLVLDIDLQSAGPELMSLVNDLDLLRVPWLGTGLPVMVTYLRPLGLVHVFRHNGCAAMAVMRNVVALCAATLVCEHDCGGQAPWRTLRVDIIMELSCNGRAINMVLKEIL